MVQPPGCCGASDSPIPATWLQGRAITIIYICMYIYIYSIYIYVYITSTTTTHPWLIFNTQDISKIPLNNDGQYNTYNNITLYLKTSDSLLSPWTETQAGEKLSHHWKDSDDGDGKILGESMGHHTREAIFWDVDMLKHTKNVFGQFGYGSKLKIQVPSMAWRQVLVTSPFLGYPMPIEKGTGTICFLKAVVSPENGLWMFMKKRKQDW